MPGQFIDGVTRAMRWSVQAGAFSPRLVARDEWITVPPATRRGALCFI